MLQYEEYKANRASTPDELRSQFPLVKEILSAHRVPIFEMDNYEADDILGTLAEGCSRGFSVLIVSGSGYLAVGFTPGEGFIHRRGITDLESLMLLVSRKSWGLSRNRWLIIRVWWGINPDNIPGVPGIGKVTAGRLLGEFANLEEILANIEGVSQRGVRSKLKQYSQQARLSKNLATIDCQTPVTVRWEELRREEPDRETLSALFQELEFRSLLQRTAPAQSAKGEVRYRSIESPEELTTLIDKIKQAGEVGFFLLCSGDDPRRGDILGCALGLPTGDTYYICPGLWRGAQRDKGIREQLAAIFSQATVKKYTHDAKVSYQLLDRYGISLMGLTFDTLIASYLLNPAAAHTLDQVAAAHVQVRVPSYEELLGRGAKAKTPSQLPGAQLAAFAAARAGVLPRLEETLRAALEELNLLTLFKQVELPLIRVLAAMEAEGVAVDIETLREMGGKWRQVRRCREVYRLAGEEFNLNSPKQLSIILFEKLGLPVIKRTKTGYSTDAEVLAKLAPITPLWS